MSYDKVFLVKDDASLEAMNNELSSSDGKIKDVYNSDLGLLFTVNINVDEQNQQPATIS